MLDQSIVNKIENFVSESPRSINEIALFLRKNWRTADRYVEYIKQNFGVIDTKTFREGTRGALKIAYWSSFEKGKNSIFHDILEKEIQTFKKKEDFSAFDIYQHIKNENKKIEIYNVNDENKTNLDNLANLIRNTKKQLIGFSGNLSWVNLKNKDINIFECIENLVKKNIPIKLISRIDLASINNINKLLELNFKYGKEIIEVRHHEQPLRAFIQDNKIIRIKEIKEPTGKIHELNQKVFIFYTINDKEWVEWLSKVFWNLFSKSIDAKKRVEQMKNLV
mgnify:CR=1 FL=1